MPRIVTLVTAPSVEPVTLAEAKLHVRQASDFTADDALITSLITAARRVCEVWESRSYVNTTWDMVDYGFPVGGGYYSRLLRQSYAASTLSSRPTFPGFLPTNTGTLILPRAPVASVTSITYVDGSGNTQTLDSSNYRFVAGSPGRIDPAYGKIWPLTQPVIGAITVRFVAGYGADASSVPENVKAAIKLLVCHWYENRESVVVGSGLVVHELPNAVEHLLSPESWGSYG